MYCELKHDQYWVWSSRLASLDCMPQYIIHHVLSANDALLDVCAIKQLTAQKKRLAIIRDSLLWLNKQR